MPMDRISKREQTSKRSLIWVLLVAIVLAACALIVCGPTPAYALKGGDNNYSWEIASAADFIEWRSGDFEGDAMLKNDITITDADLDAITSAKPDGLILREDESFDGRDKQNGEFSSGPINCITLDLKNHRGLFEEIRGFAQYVQLKGTVSYSGGNVGALAGSVTGYGAVNNCTTVANVTGTYNVGGLVGSMHITKWGLQSRSTGYIMDCANHGTVTATGAKDGDSNVGGIVGYIECEGDGIGPYGDKGEGQWYPEIDIKYCYNAGTVVGTKKNTGGIAGEAIGKRVKTGWYTGMLDEGGRTDYDVWGIERGCSDMIIFRNCYNVGAVEGGIKDAAGIVAHIKGAVAVQGSYHVGTVSADSKNTAHGIVHWNQSEYDTGLFNRVHGKPVYHCYSLDSQGYGWKDDTEQNGKVTTDPGELKKAGYNLDQMQKCNFYNNDVYTKLGTSPGDDVNQGYFILGGVGAGEEVRVWYNWLDGEHAPGEKVWSGHVPSRPKDDPERDHYTFQYWTAQPPDTKLSTAMEWEANDLYTAPPERFAFEGDDCRVFKETTLYAYYEPKLVKVTFNENKPDDSGAGTITVPSSMRVPYGAAIGVLSEAKMNPGTYSFVRWETHAIGWDEKHARVDRDFIVAEPYVNTSDKLSLDAIWQESKFYFTEQPADCEVTVGASGDAKLSVKVVNESTDSPTLTYQWYESTDGVGFTPISGSAAERDYYTPPVAYLYQEGDEFYYRCRVTATHANGTHSYIDSEPAKLTLSMAAPLDVQVDTNAITFKEVSASINRYSIDVLLTNSSVEANWFEVKLADKRVSGTIVGDDIGSKKVIEVPFTVELQAQQETTVQATLYYRDYETGTITCASAPLVTTFVTPEHSLTPATSGIAVLAEPRIDPQNDDSIWADPTEISGSVSVGDTINAVADFTWDTDPGARVATAWQYSDDNGVTWNSVDALLGEKAQQGVSTKELNGGWTTRSYLVAQVTRPLNTCMFRAVVSSVGAAFDAEYGVSTASWSLNVDMVAPTNVNVVDDSITETTATVTWDWGIDDDDVAKGFVVGFWKLNDSDNAEHYVLVDGTKRQATLTSLKPGQHYGYEITAVDGHGSQATSKPIMDFTTVEPVGGVTVSPSVAQAEEKDENGNPTKVEFIASYTGGAGTPSYQWQQSMAIEGDDDWTAIDGATQATYTYTMQKGWGDERNPVRFRCVVTVDGAEHLSTPARLVAYNMANSTPHEADALTYGIDTSWSPQEGACYQMRYRPVDSGDDAWITQMVEVQQDAPQVKMLVSGLEPETAYNCEFRTLTPDGFVSGDWNTALYSEGSPQASMTTQPEASITGVSIEDKSTEKIIAGRKSFTLAVSVLRHQGTLTYQWQYFDLQKPEEGWLDEPDNATSAKFERQATPDDYSRVWRCKVTATQYGSRRYNESGGAVYHSDSRVAQASSIAAPVIYPPGPTVSYDSDVSTIRLSWGVADKVDLYRVTYYKEGDSEKQTQIVLCAPDSTQTDDHYEPSGGGSNVVYTLTDLAPSTEYKVSVAALKLGLISNETPTSVTTKAPAASPVIALQPGNVTYENGDSASAVTFSTSVVTPEAGGGTLSAKLQMREADGAWSVVPGATVSSEADPDNAALTKFSWTLSAPSGGTWTASSARYRFLVTNTVSEKSTADTATNAFGVIVRAAMPTGFAVTADATTTTSATLTWTNDAGIDRYVVFWREKAAASAATLELPEPLLEDLISPLDAPLADKYDGWSYAIVDGDGSTPPVSYTLSALNSDTRYEAMLVSAPTDGLWSEATAAVEFITLKTSTLKSVAVTPEWSRFDNGETSATLTAAVTGGADEGNVSYQWQKQIVDSTVSSVETYQWEDVYGASSATYDAPIGTDRVARYRCVVTAGGGSTGYEKASVASNSAVIWSAFTPGDPSYLSSVPIVHSKAVAVHLSWIRHDRESDLITFLVEYRRAGTDDAWSAADAGMYGEYTLSGLAPATEYEWRVTAKCANGLDSNTVSGPNFTTEPGSALETAAVAPADTSKTDGPFTVELTVSTNLGSDSDERPVYRWQRWANDAWNTIEGATDETYVAASPSTYGTNIFRCVVVSEVQGDMQLVLSNEASVTYRAPDPDVPDPDVPDPEPLPGSGDEPGGSDVDLGGGSGGSGSAGDASGGKTSGGIAPVGDSLAGGVAGVFAVAASAIVLALFAVWRGARTKKR